MKKVTLKEKLNYKFDKLMSKGTIVLVVALAIVTLSVVAIAGVLAVLIQTNWSDGSISKSIWNTLMFAVDSGTLGGTQGNDWLILIMSIVTLCGIFITSTLIGIINSGLEAKLENLRKGTSRVIESGHTVILGFNDSVYTIISELIIANENNKKSCLVIMGNEEKPIMEEKIASKIDDFKNTSIICRSGSTSSFYDLSKCSLETSKSIIINEEDDASVIKSILAVTNILNSDSSKDCLAHISATVTTEENFEVAKIAGQGYAEILSFTNAISRILAHTCYEPGLSAVYTELFDFDGDEIYMENLPELAGKKFFDILNLFEVSTAIGIKKGTGIYLNPSMDTIIDDGDEVILIAADDGVSVPSTSDFKINENAFVDINSLNYKPKSENLLILGCNKLLINILTEMDNYMVSGSKIKIASDNEHLENLISTINKNLVNIQIIVEQCNICDRNVLEGLSREGFEHILILSDLECDIEVADSKTLLLLLHLRDIAQKYNIDYSITSEMLDSKNRELAKITNVSDFVVSRNITSLMISQISENRFLAPVFEDLLDSDGSEIYMKPVENYVNLGEKVNIYTITHAVAKRGEIFIGYRKVTKNEEGRRQIEIITNPAKAEELIFTKNDSLIVLAEEA